MERRGTYVADLAIHSFVSARTSVVARNEWMDGLCSRL
jgi:hypothetical protein